MARFAPVLVFVVVCAFMFWLVGQRLNLSNNDEGIYLDAGRRVAAGEAPFRDFFYLSGPGTPWAMGLSMKLFGVNLPAARLTLMIDLSLMAALVFWMTRRLSGSVTAAAVAGFLFVSFSTMQPSVLLPNHRWDSDAMALAAIALAWICRERPRILTALLAGLACAAATWMTPSLALFAFTLACWFVLDRQLRPQAPAFLGGGFAGLAAGLLMLHFQGALGAMIDQLFWIGRNYADSNRMVYGQVIGGYSSLTEGASGSALAVVLVILVFITIPAWLPPAATAGWIIRLRKSWSSAGTKRFEIPFLLVCGAALVAAQAPRMDLPHLMFSSPVYYALAVALAAQSFPPKLRQALAIVFLLAGSVSLHYARSKRMAETPTATRVGLALMNPSESHWLQTLQSHVAPGDSLFVFPYRPIFYFALDARNPTKYCFLQPGMSSAADEASVLADLKSNPPEWVIYMNLTPAEYLRVWPSSDPTRLRMESIEHFISFGYADTAQAGPYTLKRRR